MAVNAVDNIVDTPIIAPPETGGSSRVKISAATLAKMTAQEILDGYEKQNWDVPENIITWARQEVQTNPGSTTTWGEASKAGADKGEENDAVQYAATLEGQDMSLKEICKEFTMISAQKEAHDVNNIEKMAPFMQSVSSDEAGGDKGESEVEKVLNQIKKEMIQNFADFITVGKNFKEGMKIFKAIQRGSHSEVEGYEFDLEEIQNVLNGTLTDAKDSKQWGDETIVLGKKLKDKTSGWQIFGSRRRAAKKAIDQGEKTVKMSERTSKLANAIAKDNNVALKSVEDNLKGIDGAEVPEGGSNGSSPPTPENPS